MKHALVLLAAAAVASAALPAQTPFPTKGWPATTPAAAGINVAVLDSIDAEIKAGRYGNVDRVLVIRRGQIAWDRSYPRDYAKVFADSVNVRGALNAHDVTGAYNYYNSWWHPYYRRETSLHSLQSVTKTITSVVIGIAVTRGDFPSIDRPVLSFFDPAKVANVDDRKRRMTVKHLITMTSGIDWNEGLPYTDPRNTATALEESTDWVKFTMDRPMSEEPGTRFNYNSGATEVLAAVFRRATGRDIEDYAAEHLFKPLGIDQWYWKRIPTGLIDTEGGLYLDARDLAKIWYLFHHEGTWDGKRLVSADWVKMSLSPIVATRPTPNAQKYGLAWWLMPTPADSTRFYYYGSGFGGQFPVVVPEKDLVLVFNSWNILGGGMPTFRIVNRIVAGTK
jgi:CubicO group peptidase (beta-lactamase class C family)